jgi:hypothetical protein
VAGFATLRPEPLALIRTARALIHNVSMENSVRRFVFAIRHCRVDSHLLAVVIRGAPDKRPARMDSLNLPRAPRVHFQLVTTVSTFALVARVLRCAVWTLDADQGATYRGALQFEDRCDIVWEPETPPGSHLPTGCAHGRPAQGHAIPPIEGRSRGDRSRSVK